MSTTDEGEIDEDHVHDDEILWRRVPSDRKKVDPDDPTQWKANSDN